MSRSKSRKFADILSGNMGNILDDGLINVSEITGLGTAASSATTDFLPSTMATATNATGSDFVPVYDASSGVWKKQTITVAALQGPTGATGAAGSNGSIGADGADGAQGPQGNTGSTGPQGATGSQGPQGNTGSQGPTGSQGATGSTGPAGTPSTTYNAIGSYTIAATSSTQILAANATASGSSFIQAIYNSGNITRVTQVMIENRSGDAISASRPGTWRNMGPLAKVDIGQANFHITTIWVRIS
tara:strand:+ start:265 stop:999 length:735 start_codon:yes stop_codon:yes gene_type:complete